MFALEPDTPLIVGVVIAAVAVCSGAASAALLLSFRGTGSVRRRPAVAPALRRGAEVAAIVGLLLLLRVVDGLTVITGGFVVLGLVIAEAILSARPGRASR